MIIIKTRLNQKNNLKSSYALLLINVVFNNFTEELIKNKNAETTFALKEKILKSMLLKIKYR